MDNFDDCEFDDDVQDAGLLGESSMFELPHFQDEEQYLHVSSAMINSISTILRSHERCIVHVDIDCFYAQVEMNKNPTLRHKAMGVHQKNLVVTTNYAARNAGVPKTCWVHEARKICPDLVLVNGEDLHDYRKVSKNIFEYLVKTYRCPVERLGMDENFLDITSLVQNRLGSASIPVNIQGRSYSNVSEISCKCGCDSMLRIGSEIAKEIRDGIFAEFSITSSAGIAHNKTLSKMVGVRHKPNDQTTIFPSDVNMFMLEHDDVKAIPGIGSALTKLLKSKEIHSIQDLQNTSIESLRKILNETTATKIQELSFGIDHSIVKTSLPCKSIGLEDRFKQISTKNEYIKKFEWLLDRICILLHEDGRLPRVLKVTVRDYLKHKTIKKFYKESRQCKINPNLFKNLSNSNELDIKSRTELVDISVSLLRKMVDAENDFHLTLLGLSVGDFVHVHNKRSISAFFTKKTDIRPQITDIKPPIVDIKFPITDTEPAITNMSTPTSTLISKKPGDLKSDVLSKSPSNGGLRSFFLTAETSSEAATADIQNNKRLLNESENFAVSSAKKIKLLDDYAKLPHYGRNAVNYVTENACPYTECASEEPMSPGTHSGISNNLNSSQISLPKGWDPKVFFELPDDIQKELLQHNTATVEKPVKKSSVLL